jgi:hypothetical protein
MDRLIDCRPGLRGDKVPAVKQPLGQPAAQPRAGDTAHPLPLDIQPRLHALLLHYQQVPASRYPSHMHDALLLRPQQVLATRPGYIHSFSITRQYQHPAPQLHLLPVYCKQVPATRLPRLNALLLHHLQLRADR